MYKIIDRIMKETIPEPNSGCWLWIGYTMKNGYGQITYCQKSWLAHRLSFYGFNNIDPKELYVCHKCDNPSCVNPDHLFLGTHKDNMKDMVSKKRQPNIKKTHCPNGHEYSDENTKRYKFKGGWTSRFCRECMRIAGRKYKARKKFEKHALSI